MCNASSGWPLIVPPCHPPAQDPELQQCIPHTECVGEGVCPVIQVTSGENTQRPTKHIFQLLPKMWADQMSHLNWDRKQRSISNGTSGQPAGT